MRRPVEPELDLRRAAGLDLVPGVASSTTLGRHVEALEQSTAARRAATPGTGEPRRHKEFHDGARSRSRLGRIVARVEAGPWGTGARLVATDLAGGTARRICEDLHCRRGLMPKRSTRRVAQLDTLRVRLVEPAARVVAPKTRAMPRLPSACPAYPARSGRLKHRGAPSLTSIMGRITPTPERTMTPAAASIQSDA